MGVTGNGVRVYGVELVRGDAAHGNGDPQLVPFRDLAAVVRQAPYAAVQPTPEELADYRATVDGVFRRGTIVPAPFGTVMRSREQVLRWLEMNYIALAEGLQFVHGRCQARLHIGESPDVLPEERRADVAAVAEESFRALRRQVAAAIPMRADRADGTSPGYGGAFLVRRSAWADLAEAVAEQARRHESLCFELTGPWPPYDFVRVDFGGGH
ncbi:MAG TPA: GvpL/GvpF family gas vesicle protein [Gemmatimonadaceae bacterium]|nr:GvpL/GvpF family gas vesicle protein [Gemmatimonadaceae bacterium]